MLSWNSKMVWVKKEGIIMMRRIKGGFTEEVALMLDFKRKIAF